ncbi:MAG: hypothetical protein HUU02_09030 [Bacteroidetes bacterium]|nr:hypothetical protein [Bacteroidota bacterium]
MAERGVIVAVYAEYILSWLKKIRLWRIFFSAGLTSCKDNESLVSNKKEVVMNEDANVDLISKMMQTIIQAITNELDELIINARWLGSVVLALIAGLVGYQNLLGSNKLSLPFALVSAILGLTMLCFIIVTHVARRFKRKINLRYLEITENTNTIILNRDLSPNEKDQRLKKDVYSKLKDFQSFSELAVMIEFIGLLLLAASALLTIFVIFIKELL